MNNPAKANQPISNSMNVMGPNPLIYPQSYQPEDDNTSTRSNCKDSQQQTEQQSGSSSSIFDSGIDTTSSSTNRSEVKCSRNIQHFERLFAAVNDNGKLSQQILFYWL